MPDTKKRITLKAKKGSGSMAQYYRTSITMPVAVAEELNQRRGKETFSGQIVNDLSVYWEAVRSGMSTLRHKFTKKEACFIADALDARTWGSMKLDEMALSDLIETVKNDGLAKKYKVSLATVIEKLEGLNLIELLALLNWSRTARQREDDPEKAAAQFPKE
jgi:hypothetical protein